MSLFIAKAVTRLMLLALVGLVVDASPCLAQSQTPNLSQLSIEDLINVPITSASRKEQRAGDVAAAIFVITHDDIRRSGMTTIPDLLRLVPGVDVAQVNSNKWAVSVRGFNGLFANKLLVLVDGRSIYNRIFSGVLWDTQDLLVDDIDRIEVIRGPGAALWGANAVNGVINIVTKTTADTKGGLVRVDGGRLGEQAAVRYGGTRGAVSYRLYSQWTGFDQPLVVPDTRDERSHSATTGFRADWTVFPNALTVDGEFTAGRARALSPSLNPLTPLANQPSDTQGGHLLGRWTHTRRGGASLQLQSSLDIASREEPVGHYDRRAFAVDTQYHAALGAHHDLVAGGGFSLIDESLVGRVGFLLIPDSDRSTLVSAFVQDEIGLFQDRLAVTLGSQVQDDADFGAGIQPTARVIWKGFPRQRLWAASSRALRTPSLVDESIRVDYPPVPAAGGLPLFVTVLGNPAAATETFVDAEAGYRLEIGTAASIDVTGFVGRYENLKTLEVSAPVIQFVPLPRILVTSQFSNLLEATTRGLELAGHWTPAPAWRFDGSQRAFRVVPQPAATSRDPAAATEDGSAPRTQWQVRSAFSPATRATLSLAIFHVGPLEVLQVGAYTRADVNAEWRFTSRLSVMAIGQNLFDPAHAEFRGPGALTPATKVPRTAGLRVRWTF